MRKTSNLCKIVHIKIAFSLICPCYTLIRDSTIIRALRVMELLIGYTSIGTIYLLRKSLRVLCNLKIYVASSNFVCTSVCPLYKATFFNLESWNLVCRLTMDVVGSWTIWGQLLRPLRSKEAMTSLDMLKLKEGVIFQGYKVDQLSRFRRTGWPDPKSDLWGWMRSLVADRFLIINCILFL